MQAIGILRQVQCDSNLFLNAKRSLYKKTTLALLVFAVILSACENGSEQSNLADVCQKEDGTLVTVEGFLLLPNFMNIQINSKTEPATYELYFAAQPDGKSASVRTTVPGTRSNEANHIAELPPDGYTQSDLRIFTDSGEPVNSFERVRITGRLSKNKIRGAASFGNGASLTGKSCVLTIEKIEKS